MEAERLKKTGGLVIAFLLITGRWTGIDDALDSVIYYAYLNDGFLAFMLRYVVVIAVWYWLVSGLTDEVKNGNNEQKAIADKNGKG